MRSLGRALIYYDWCPNEKRRGDSGGCYVTREAGLEWCWQPQKLRTRDGIYFPQRLRREHDPADTWIWDFKPPHPWENTSLFFKATPCVVLCDSSPRKLKQQRHLSQVLCLEGSWSHARGSQELCPEGNENASLDRTPRSINCGWWFISLLDDL